MNLERMSVQSPEGFEEDRGADWGGGEGAERGFECELGDEEGDEDEEDEDEGRSRGDLKSGNLFGPSEKLLLLVLGFGVGFEVDGSSKLGSMFRR